MRNPKPDLEILHQIQLHLVKKRSQRTSETLNSKSPNRNSYMPAEPSYLTPPTSLNPPPPNNEPGTLRQSRVEQVNPKL